MKEVKIEPLEVQMPAITSRFADGDWFRNRHWGETCIIIGNGPSLKQVPLDFLRSLPTFASNYIHLFDKFIPTYYSVHSYVVFNTEEKQRWIRPTVVGAKAAFVSQHGYHHFPYDHVYPTNPVIAMIFSREPFRWLFYGANSTYVNLQYAFFMGFHKVWLVGVDHDYEGWKTGKAYHFSEDYPTVDNIRPVQTVESIRRVMNEEFRIACREFESAGRQVINLSPVSRLPYFPKGELKDAIHSSNAPRHGA